LNLLKVVHDCLETKGNRLRAKINNNENLKNFKNRGDESAENRRNLFKKAEALVTHLQFRFDLDSPPPRAIMPLYNPTTFAVARATRAER